MRLVAAALVALAACGSADAGTNSGTSTPDAMVGVLAEGCGPSPGAGSGVVLGPPGHVVTVAHTVAGATDITVVKADGTEWSAALVAIDTRADLAVLAVDDTAGFDIPALAIGGPVLDAATVHAWSVDGGPTTRPVEVTTRLAITIDDIHGDQSGERSGIELTGDIEVGDSGGPVVTADGTVIGIVYARSRTRAHTAFATDDAEIEQVLAAVSPEPVDTGRCV